FVDWSPLSGRDVILWPDNDKPGVDCMHALAAILHPVCKSVNIVTPPDFGTGWDLADDAPEEFSQSKWAKDNMTLYVSSEPEPEHVPCETSSSPLADYFGKPVDVFGVS